MTASPPNIIPDSWRTRYALIVIAALATSVPFYLQYSYILNAFYHYGVPFFDGGLFAQLIWHNDLLLMTPHPRGDFSYLAIHFSQFLVVVNVLSYCAADMVGFFAIFMAGIYASLAGLMYAALISCVQPKKVISAIYLAALAIAFSFNGIVMQGIWMPHFEYAIPGAIMAFLLCLGKKRVGWAVFFFVIALSMREDVGLHIALVLGLLTALRSWKARALGVVKTELSFIIWAILYSALAFVLTTRIQHMYGLTDTPLRFIYTGTPAYAHLSIDLLFNKRLAIILSEHLYIATCLCISLAWTLLTRNAFWLVGYLANVPWIVFNWCASYDYPGTLNHWYGFPIVTAMGWPVLGALWSDGPVISRRHLEQMLILQTLLAVSGLICWDSHLHRLSFAPIYGARLGGYAMRESSADRDAIWHFTQRLDSVKELGVIMVDDNVMSLTMGSVTQKRGLNLVEPDVNSAIDTFVYFKEGGIPAEDTVKHVQANRLDQHFCVGHTVLCLFTNRNQGQLGPLASELTMVPSPPLQ